MNQAKQGDGTRERISALADSELDPAQAQAALDELLGSVDARVFWRELHAAGDCVRSEETGAAAGDTGFLERFSARLGEEPVVLAPRALAGRGFSQRAWLRYGLPGASIAAGVAMVLWMAVPQMSQTDGQIARVAEAPREAAVVVQKSGLGAEVGAATSLPASVVQMDPDQVGEYLTAHQGSVRAASLTIVPNKVEQRP